MSIATTLPAAASIASIPLFSAAAPALSPSSLAPLGATTASVASGPAVPPSLQSLSPWLASLPPISADAVTPLRLSPLILSPALSPIPAKVVEKARSGAFVDFKEFLGDNALLLQRIQDLSQAGATPGAAQSLVSNSRMREVSDPLTWASCFLAFLAAKIDHEETRRLAAYAMIILQLARKHGGSGWLLYDRQFRLQQAAGAGLSWADINPSLLAATVLGQPGERTPRACSLCLAADHSREDCALASLEAHRPPFPVPANRPQLPARQSRRPLPYRLAGQCYRFNAGNCNSSNCRFEHRCAACSSPNHPEISCPEVKGRPRGRQADAKSSPTSPRTSPAAERPRQ